MLIQEIIEGIKVLYIGTDRSDCQRGRAYTISNIDSDQLIYLRGISGMYTAPYFAQNFALVDAMGEEDTKIINALSARGFVPKARVRHFIITSKQFRVVSIIPYLGLFVGSDGKHHIINDYSVVGKEEKNV